MKKNNYPGPCELLGEFKELIDKLNINPHIVMCFDQDMICFPYYYCSHAE